MTGKALSLAIPLIYTPTTIALALAALIVIL